MIQWLVSAKFVTGVTCIVSDEQGRVLLVRQTYKKYLWNLPGGFMEYGETTVEAALRELREEASVNGSIVRLIGMRTSPKRRLIDVIYLCRGEELAFIPNAESTARGWFSLDAMPESIAPELVAFIKLVLQPAASEQETTSE